MRPNELLGVNEKIISPIFFVELDLPSGRIRLTTNQHDLIIDRELFTAVGYLGKVSFSGEVIGVEVGRADLELVGLPVFLYQEMEREVLSRRDVKISLAILSEGNDLIFAPVPVFSGKISQINLSPLPTLSVSIEVAGRLSTIKSSISSRYTNADQRANFPDDKGLEFVAKLATTELLWGG